MKKISYVIGAGLILAVVYTLFIGNSNQEQYSVELQNKIEAKKNPWILQFPGLSLSSPEEKSWAVKKDGGEFDQFTGATITPRAVVRSVRLALQFFQQHGKALAAEPQQEGISHGE